MKGEVHIKRLLLTVLLLQLLIGNLAVKTFYQHSHLVNGQLVQHAHPYNTSSDSSPIKTHHHTSFDWVLADSGKVFVKVACTAIPENSAHNSENISTPYHFNYEALFLAPHSNRAPPLA